MSDQPPRPFSHSDWFQQSNEPNKTPQQTRQYMHQPPSHLQAAQQHSDEYDAHVSHVSTGPPPSGYHSMVQEHLLDPSISPGMQANSPVTYLQDPNTPFTAQSSRHAQPSSSTAHPFYGPSASSTGQQQQQQPYESSGSTSALGVVLSSPEPPAPPRIILHRAINEAEQLRKRMMRADEASQPSRTKRPRALSDLVPAQHNVGGGSSRHSPSDRNLAETRDEISSYCDELCLLAERSAQGESSADASRLRELSRKIVVQLSTIASETGLPSVGLNESVRTEPLVDSSRRSLSPHDSTQAHQSTKGKRGSEDVTTPLKPATSVLHSQTPQEAARDMEFIRARRDELTAKAAAAERGKEHALKHEQSGLATTTTSPEHSRRAKSKSAGPPEQSRLSRNPAALATTDTAAPAAHHEPHQLGGPSHSFLPPPTLAAATAAASVYPPGGNAGPSVPPPTSTTYGGHHSTLLEPPTSAFSSFMSFPHAMLPPQQTQLASDEPMPLSEHEPPTRSLDSTTTPGVSDLVAPFSSRHTERDHQDPALRPPRPPPPPQQQQQQQLPIHACHSCGITQAMEWKQGPDGPGTLCQTCGAQWLEQAQYWATLPSYTRQM